MKVRISISKKLDYEMLGMHLPKLAAILSHVWKAQFFICYPYTYSLMFEKHTNQHCIHASMASNIKHVLKIYILLF